MKTGICLADTTQGLSGDEAIHIHKEHLAEKKRLDRGEAETGLGRIKEEAYKENEQK